MENLTNKKRGRNSSKNEAEGENKIKRKFKSSESKRKKFFANLSDEEHLISIQEFIKFESNEAKSIKSNNQEDLVKFYLFAELIY